MTLIVLGIVILFFVKKVDAATGGKLTISEMELSNKDNQTSTEIEKIDK